MVHSRPQHLFGAARILADAELCRASWNIDPSAMQDWLTNDQNINPFNPAAPLDADMIADHFHHCWQLHHKNKRQEQTSNNKNKSNKKSRDNDNHASSNTVQNNNKKARNDKGNSDASMANTGGGGRDDDRGRCPIQGHETMHHDWLGCRLNPFASRYDAKAGQEFYDNKAHGPNMR